MYFGLTFVLDRFWVFDSCSTVVLNSSECLKQRSRGYVLVSCLWSTQLVAFYICRTCCTFVAGPTLLYTCTVVLTLSRLLYTLYKLFCGTCEVLDITLFSFSLTSSLNWKNHVFFFVPNILTRYPKTMFFICWKLELYKFRIVFYQVKMTKKTFYTK